VIRKPIAGKASQSFGFGGRYLHELVIVNGPQNFHCTSQVN
jgi:hypothetical protein